MLGDPVITAVPATSHLMVLDQNGFSGKISIADLESQLNLSPGSINLEAVPVDGSTDGVESNGIFDEFTRVNDSLAVRVRLNPNSQAGELFFGDYAAAQAVYGVDPNAWPTWLLAVVPDFPTTPSTLDNLSDVTKGSVSANSSATLRVLADPNGDGNYEEYDWTPPAGSGATNLSYTASTTDGTVASDTGTNATIPAGSGTNASLMLPADKNKLDGIEALADVTDATNVDAAGATMNSDTDVSTNGWVVDEDDMVSDDPTKVPTQQSVKAYVDANAGGLNTNADLDLTSATNTGWSLRSNWISGGNPNNTRIFGLNSSAYWEVNLNGSVRALVMGTTSVRPDVAGVMDLGSIPFPFDQGYFSGTVQSSGYLIPGGTVDDIVVANGTTITNNFLSNPNTSQFNVSRTLAATDAYGTVSFFGGAALTCTINQGVFAEDVYVFIENEAATSVTITAGTGITLVGESPVLAAGEAAKVTQVSTDEWKVLRLSENPSGGGATNLSYTPSATDGTVNSDTGTNATIPSGSTTNASLMLPADKTKLDNLPVYEYDNFTPTFTDSGGGATYTGTPTASYTRNGNQITIRVFINIGTTGTPTGEFRIGNLPTIDGTTTYNGTGAINLSGFYTVGTYASSGTSLLSKNIIVHSGGAGYLTINVDYTGSGIMAPLDNVVFDSGGQIDFTITCTL